MSKILSTAGLMVILFLQVGCGDIKLSPYTSIAYSQSASDISFCTTPSNTIHSNLKFIFVVDRSGSNQLRYVSNGATPPSYTPLRCADYGNPVGCTPGTDPTGAKRFGAIQDFVSGFQGDQYTYWSEVNFSSTASVGQGFTNDQVAFGQYIQGQETPNGPGSTPNDGGTTDYLGALAQVQQMIQADVAAGALQTPQISSNYVIFFMSDGSPFITLNGQQALESSAQILNTLTNLISLQQQNLTLIEGIAFNTEYYTAPPVLLDNGTDPSVLLTNMASTGNGSFLNVGAGQQIDFSRFVPPVRISRFALKEIWIANANTVWWFWQGSWQLMLDSDGDGIPDVVELAMGSDPYKYDSDGNGVGDGVEYRITGKVCNTVAQGGTPNAHCVAASANPFTICAGLPATTNADGSVTYADSDGDYLNDCEEKLLGTNAKDPDTNHDYLPDWMAFINQVSMIGTSDLQTDPDSDGLTNYQEIKQNTPPFVNNSTVPGLVKLNYQGHMVSSDATQDCYSYSLVNLPFHTTGDKIRIFLFENTTSISQNVIVRTTEKPLDAFGIVNVTDSDFKRIQ